LHFIYGLALDPDAAVRRSKKTFDRYWAQSLMVAKFVVGLDAAAPPLAGLSGSAGSASLPLTRLDRFIDDLLVCLGDYNIYPAGFALDVSAWRKFNKNARMFLTGGRYDMKNDRWITPSAPNKTYYLPFQFCVVAPTATCKPHLKVHYAFDLNKQFKNHATDLFKHLKKDETIQCRDRIGELALPTSEEAPGLQAADLLAYQSYQFCKTRLCQPRPTTFGELPTLLKDALKNMRDDGDFRLFDEKGLRTQALKNLPKHLRS